ncbi:hypothetical protein, partial [Plebeiibacterium sediminum]
IYTTYKDVSFLSYSKASPFCIVSSIGFQTFSQIFIRGQHQGALPPCFDVIGLQPMFDLMLISFRSCRLIS